MHEIMVLRVTRDIYQQTMHGCDCTWEDCVAAGAIELAYHKNQTVVTAINYSSFYTLDRLAEWALDSKCFESVTLYDAFWGARNDFWTSGHLHEDECEIVKTIDGDVLLKTLISPKTYKDGEFK